MKTSDAMPQLTVRNVPESIVHVLKARATQAGRSAEAEHRRILEAALSERTASDNFFVNARARRVKLSQGHPDTTELLRRDRDREA